MAFSEYLKYQKGHSQDYYPVKTTLCLKVDSVTKNQDVKFNTEGITVRNVTSGMMECIQNAKVSKLGVFYIQFEILEASNRAIPCF